jgi:hypothetical protein
MISLIFTVFLVLHGLVHLLYLGQSAGYFELQPGLSWPSGSWAFSRFLGDETTRSLASILLAVAALAFVAGGVTLAARQVSWRSLVAGAAIFSAITFLLMWDGGWQHLDDKGAVGLMINLALLVAVAVLHWPQVGF